MLHYALRKFPKKKAKKEKEKKTQKKSKRITDSGDTKNVYF